MATSGSAANIVRPYRETTASPGSLQMQPFARPQISEGADVGEREAQRPAVYARGDAGVEHPASAGIEVGPQFRVVIRKGRELQHGDQRRQAPSLGKRESGQRNRRVENHLAARLQRAAEGGIEVILLGEAQGD